MNKSRGRCRRITGILLLLQEYKDHSADIDNGNIEDILGTIAGDDTIFIVVKEGCDRDNVLRSLNETLARM